MAECGRFKYAIEKLKDPFRDQFSAGSVLFSDGSSIVEDNGNLFWDDTNNRLGIGLNSGMPAQTGLSVSGEIDLLHTAANNDDHAIEIDIDAAGFGDVKAIDIEYKTGAISAGEDEAVILVDINEFDAAGGDVFGLEVLATDGGADNIFGMKVGAVVGPILQESGTFANPTTGTNDTPSTDIADMIDGSTGTNTTIFMADDDYILIGAAAPFTEMEFNIEMPANNPGIKPTFGYSITGSHQFTTFSPVDGTDGFRHSGVIAWDAADLTAHVANDDTGTYDIKILRTHAVAGSVSLFFAKTAATVVFSWDKDGNVLVNKYLLDNANQFLHATSATNVNLNAATTLTFGIGGNDEITIAANEIFFLQPPTNDVGLGWGTVSELHVLIDGSERVAFAEGEFKPINTNDIDLGIETTNEFKDAFFSGEVLANTFQSDVASGTPPLVVASVDKVVNFNSDSVDGLHVGTSGNALGALDGTNTWSADQIFSSTNKIQLRSVDSFIHSPGAGSLTVNAQSLLNLATSGTTRVTITAGANSSSVLVQAPNFDSTVSTGTQPYACTSTTINTNLNANFLQGHAATGILIEDGVDDTPTTLAVSTDPVMALVLSTTTGVASVFYEAHGYLVGAANNDAEWTIAVEDPAGVVLKTIIVKQDATGAGDTFRLPFYIQGYDTGPTAGGAGYHLDVDEVSGNASLEVLQTKLTRVAA